VLAKRFGHKRIQIRGHRKRSKRKGTSHPARKRAQAIARRNRKDKTPIRT